MAFAGCGRLQLKPYSVWLWRTLRFRKTSPGVEPGLVNYLFAVSVNQGPDDEAQAAEQQGIREPMAREGSEDQAGNGADDESPVGDQEGIGCRV